MRRYKIGNDYFWYNEGEQPSNAILVEKKVEPKKENKVETKIDTDIKIRVPKNKSKGVSKK